MQRTTQILNLCTLILMVITGLFIHIRFNLILNDLSLGFLWGIIIVLISLHLEYAFGIVKRVI